jgi:hypothetical protein
LEYDGTSFSIDSATPTPIAIHLDRLLVLADHRHQLLALRSHTLPWDNVDDASRTLGLDIGSEKGYKLLLDHRHLTSQYIIRRGVNQGLTSRSDTPKASLTQYPLQTDLQLDPLFPTILRYAFTRLTRWKDGKGCVGRYVRFQHH